MDNNTILKLNMYGKPYVEGDAATPKSTKIELISEPTQTRIPQAKIEEARKERAAKQGQFAWSLLHRYRGCDPQWLELWVYFIPQRCNCADGYQKIIEQYPPDFSSPEAFFVWGVLVHNKVNEKLENPQVTLEEAIRIWERTDVKL